MTADTDDAVITAHLKAQIALAEAHRCAIAGYWTGDANRLHLSWALASLDTAARAYGYTLTLADDAAEIEAPVLETANENH